MRDLKHYEDDDEYYFHCSYDELIASMEFEVVLEVHDSDYQGDSRYLLRDGDRYGLLFFGWGSCSGCDSMEACDNVAEATELRDSLVARIHWFDTKADALYYVQTNDWELRYEWRANETKEFLTQAEILLNN